MRHIVKFAFVLFCAVAITWSLIDSTTGATGSKVSKKSASIKGIVTDSHQRPLEGATVFMVDASLINMTAMTPAAVLSGAAEPYDEPLEDLVNNPDIAKTLPKGVTDKSGKFSVKGLDPVAKYFAFTVPAATDVDHLPGGDQSRVAFQIKTPKPAKTSKSSVGARAADKGLLHIEMSWKPPANAEYIGTSACYVCHGPGSKLDMTSNRHHGHALMFRRLGEDCGNQDSRNHAGTSWTDIEAKFTLATAYNKPLSGTFVETLYFQDFDSTQGNKFVIYENTPGTSQIYVKAYLWKSPANIFYVTLENVITPKDPSNFATFVVPLTMGGYIKQRMLLNVPGLKGLYKFITYQSVTGSASVGVQASYDRTRKPWVEGGGGGGSFTDFFDTTKKTIKFPNATVSNVSCAACHLGFGSYEKFTDPITGETLAHTVGDSNGVFDLGGDGELQDVGVNCEQCHGPGSKHREEAIKGVFAVGTTPPKGKIPDTTATHIVNPAKLGADRASLICGRCHDPRGILASEEDNFPPPGISRAEFISKYVNPAQKGIPTASLYPDGVHGKGGHHGFTYSNFLLSKHYRNSTRMLACDDCHDAMGDSPFRYSLLGDPDDSSKGKGLCNSCHDKDVGQHVTEKTGNAMLSGTMKCINCHMTRVGKSGAGRPGTLLQVPAGTTADAKIEYWENDQSSHVFDVPHKFDKGVAGQNPGDAMPAPYTNACGTCHDAAKLQFQQPQ